MTSTPSSTSTTTTPAVVLSPEILDSVKSRSFTLANADKGLATAVKSDKGALSFLAGVRDTVKSTENVKAVAAAYAIEAGLARGWKQADIATAIGVSPSMATLYKRMGLAHRKGITPASDPGLWSDLHAKAYANDQNVAAVLGDSDASVEDVRKAVAAKVKAVANGPAESSDSDTGGNGTNGYVPDVPRGFNQKIVMMEAVIAGMASRSKPLSAAEIKQVEKVGRNLAALLREARKAA